jgi:hypothetical protein
MYYNVSRRGRARTAAVFSHADVYNMMSAGHTIERVRCVE